MFKRKIKFDLFTLANKWSTETNFLKRFIANGWNNLVMETKYRLSGSVSLSIVLHIIFLLGYFALGTLDQPLEPPIREISFVDMTEIEKPPEEVIKKKVSPPVFQPTIAENITPEKAESTPNVTPKNANAPIVLGSDRLFLDQSRKQAPINVDRYEPVAANVNQVKDVLKVSPAIGIKNDDKVAKPAQVELTANRDLLLASTSQSQGGAIAFNRQGNPNIDLNASKTSSAPVVSSPAVFSSPTPSPKKEEPLIKPKETQTIITGALANRKIIKKVIPPFPQWAKRQGVGATISLRFTVMENGTVKETVITERTSGSSQWDQMVIAALKDWRFEPLSTSGVRKDQTGVITFQFVI
ncbi:MAG: TonB family protein [Calditrichaeota bacterium]|nr:TonB family protein [Calditrichota bacterium]